MAKYYLDENKMRVLDLTGDREDDWIKKADPQKAETDRKAHDEAWQIHLRKTLMFAQTKGRLPNKICKLCRRPVVKVKGGYKHAGYEGEESNAKTEET